MFYELDPLGIEGGVVEASFWQLAVPIIILFFDNKYTK